MKRKILNLLFSLVLVLSFGLMTALPATPALADVTYTLEVVHYGNGEVTSPGEDVFTYAAGTIVTLVATAGSGATFLSWVGDIDTIADPNASTTTITMNGNYSIYANFSGGTTTPTTSTYTITATAGANGSISPSGATTVNSGGSQTYTITPNAGYRIADVQVDGSSVGAVASYTFSSVTTAHTIAASFAINAYTITATAAANGSISPSGAVTVNYGGSQTYTITPGTGYHIANVLVDGASVGAVASYAFTNVTTAHTIAASFAINTYTITATAAANGSISPSGAVTVNYGGSQTYTITAGTGYHIAVVLVDGASVGAVASYTFTSVTTGHTIAASFAINTYTITPTASDHGSISPAGAATINYGGSQTYTITPGTGYHIADVLVDGASVGAAASYTFTSVTTGHTIAASYAINTYTITPTAGDHGSISPFTAMTVNYGDSQTFTIAANTGYRIADVLVDGSSVGAVASYTFTKVTTTHTLEATFTIGWPFYTAFGIGVVLVFLLGFLVGKSTGAYH